MGNAGTIQESMWESSRNKYGNKDEAMEIITFKELSDSNSEASGIVDSVVNSGYFESYCPTKNGKLINITFFDFLGLEPTSFS